MSFVSGLRYHQEVEEEHFYEPETTGYYVAAPPIPPPPLMFRPPPVTVAYASVVYGPPLILPTYQAPPPPPPVVIPRPWPSNCQCFVDNYGRIFSYEHHHVEEDQSIVSQQQEQQGPLIPLTYHYVVKSPWISVHSQDPSEMPEQHQSRSHKRKHHESMGHHRHHHHHHHHQQSHPSGILKIVDITYGEEKAEVLMGKRVTHSSPEKAKRRNKTTAARVYLSEEGYLVEEPQESGDEEPPSDSQ